MANWNNIGSKVKSVATKTAKTTGEIAESASMKVKLSMLISKRDEQFKKLGILTYDQLKNGDSHAEEISGVMSQIETLNSQISKQKGKIEKQKAKRAAEKALAKEKKEQEKQENSSDADTPSCAQKVQKILNEEERTEKSEK